MHKIVYTIKMNACLSCLRLLTVKEKLEVHNKIHFTPGSPDAVTVKKKIEEKK